MAEPKPNQAGRPRALRGGRTCSVFLGASHAKKLDQLARAATRDRGRQVGKSEIVRELIEAAAK